MPVLVIAPGPGLGKACRLAGEAGAGHHPKVSVELGEPAERTAPGQLACLYAGETIVGYGTVA